DGGGWVFDEDDENSNNTLDFSAVQGDVTVTVSDQNSYQISYSTVTSADVGGETVETWAQHTVTVKFMSSDGSQQLTIGDKTFNLGGTAPSGKTILDYSGYATGVTVDLSGPTADGDGNEVPPPPPTGFGYVRNIGAVRGSTNGGNTITVVGDTTVTVYTGDTIKGSGGGNTYELE